MVVHDTEVDGSIVVHGRNEIGDTAFARVANERHRERTSEAIVVVPLSRLTITLLPPVTALNTPTLVMVPRVPPGKPGVYPTTRFVFPKTKSRFRAIGLAEFVSVVPSSMVTAAALDS